MFKGTFKDVVTNIISVLIVISNVIGVIVEYNSTANLDNPLLYIVGLGVAIALWFIGKGSNGKAKPPTL